MTQQSIEALVQELDELSIHKKELSDRVCFRDQLELNWPRLSAVLKNYRGMTTVNANHEELVKSLYSVIEERDRLKRENATLMETLKGVVTVADRKTKEFDAAREALAEAEKIRGGK